MLSTLLLQRSPRLLLAAIITAICIVAYAPMQIAVFRQLWGQPHTQFFPFVIAAVVGLVAMRWGEAEESGEGFRVQGSGGREAKTASEGLAPWSTVVLVGVAWVVLGAGVLLYAPWLAALSLILLLAGVTAAIARHRHLTYLWGIWALLWLTLPLPFAMDQRLIVRLQGWSSMWSSWLLDALGVRHLMEGNTLTLASGGKQLFVDEACSGIVSVMSIVACGAIYGVWKNRPPVHVVLLAILSVFWAFVTNVLRISTIALVREWWGLDWSAGTAHEVISLVVFCIAFGALVATDLLLTGMLAPIGAKLAERIEGQLVYGRRLVDWADRVFSWGDPVKGNGEGGPDADKDDALSGEAGGEARPRGVRRGAVIWGGIVGFGLLAAAQWVWLPSTDTSAAQVAIERALAIGEYDMPEEIGPWQRLSFEAIEREVYSDFGRYSRTYRYRNVDTGAEVDVSLDFPYRGGWHDLCMCYRNTGWTIDERIIAKPPSDAPSDNTGTGEDWPFVDGTMTSPTRGEARVVFAGFDVNGAPADPPSDLVLFRPWFKLRREMLMNLAPQLFQVQVFQVRAGREEAGSGEASAGKSRSGGAGSQGAQSEELQELLVAACQRFRGLVTATIPAATASAATPADETPANSAPDGAATAAESPNVPPR
jgi:exosortase